MRYHVGFSLLYGYFTADRAFLAVGKSLFRAGGGNAVHSNLVVGYHIGFGLLNRDLSANLAYLTLRETLFGTGRRGGRNCLCLSMSASISAITLSTNYIVRRTVLGLITSCTSIPMVVIVILNLPIMTERRQCLLLCYRNSARRAYLALAKSRIHASRVDCGNLIGRIVLTFVAAYGTHAVFKRMSLVLGRHATIVAGVPMLIRVVTERRRKIMSVLIFRDKTASGTRPVLGAALLGPIVSERRQIYLSTGHACLRLGTSRCSSRLTFVHRH